MQRGPPAATVGLCRVKGMVLTSQDGPLEGQIDGHHARASQKRTTVEVLRIFMLTIKSKSRLTRPRVPTAQAAPP